MAQQSTASTDKPSSDDVLAQPESLPKAESASTEEDRVICRREKAIGSNRVMRVCRSTQDVRAERESAQEAVRNGEVRVN